MLTKHRFQPRSLRRQCGLRYERDNDALVNVVYVKAIPTTKVQSHPPSGRSHQPNGDSLPIDDDEEDFSFLEDPTDHSAAAPHHSDSDSYDDFENFSDVDEDAFRR
ncbi:hypothetical protein EV2_030268 [Malus domestica]